MNPDSINDIHQIMNIIKLNTEQITHNAIKNRQYIIGSFTPGQGVSFSQNPTVQYSEMQARAECRRLAEQNKNKTYFYVQLKGAEKVITQPQNVSI